MRYLLPKLRADLDKKMVILAGAAMLCGLRLVFAALWICWHFRRPL